MHHIVLRPGGCTIDLHYPGEAVYYVRALGGQVTHPDDGEVQGLIEGSMIHVEPGTRYQFSAGPDGMTLFGGPCPADRGLQRAAGALKN